MTVLNGNYPIKHLVDNIRLREAVGIEATIAIASVFNVLLVHGILEVTMALWLVRAGRQGEHERKFRADQRLYLTWGGLKVNLLNLPNRDSLLELLRKSSPEDKPKKLGNHVGQIWRFVREIKKGDLIVMPSKHMPTIQVGEVTGDYIFDPNLPAPFHHWREVKWISEAVPRSFFGKDLNSSFNAFMTIYRVKKNDAEARLNAMRECNWKPESSVIRAMTAVTALGPVNEPSSSQEARSRVSDIDRGGQGSRDTLNGVRIPRSESPNLPITLPAPMSPTSSESESTLELDEDEATTASEVEDAEAGTVSGRRKIFTDKSDPSIRDLLSRYQEGDLVLDPLFQRRAVWDAARSSRLIESVLLEVPLPVVYLAEERDGKQEVIDGQQRLSAFFRFISNDYELRGLRALSTLNGKKFRDLEKPLQKLLTLSSIRTITFKKESDEELRFEIFERLNTGAVPLNRQELRNCIFRGQYNDALAELSTDAEYRQLMGLSGPEKRMRDTEYVLRFAAFYHTTYLNYRPPMARFLDLEMQRHQSATEEELLLLRNAFKSAVRLIRSLLGQHAFKRFYRGTEKSPNGRWEPKKFNASLFDILMWSFARADKNRVMANLDSIREALICLMTDDPDFVESIEKSTSALSMVQRRFDKWRSVLDPILATEPRQARLFSREIKQQLHDANPTCRICDQHIAELDDAAVDHIEQYWMGGRTIPSNARLTHRYCNQARSRFD